MTRKTYWTLLATFSATLAVAVACSEPAQIEDKEGEDGPGGVNELSTRDLCLEYCEKFAACVGGGNGGGNGGGSSEGIEGACRDSCLGAMEKAADEECTSSFHDLVECSVESFSCSFVTGSGDFPCDQESEEYNECLPESSSFEGS